MDWVRCPVSSSALDSANTEYTYSHIKIMRQPGMVMHTCNLKSHESEVGEPMQV